MRELFDHLEKNGEKVWVGITCTQARQGIQMLYTHITPPYIFN